MINLNVYVNIRIIRNGFLNVYRYILRSVKNMLLYRYTMAGLERVEFITSQKGGQQVFYAGFRYRLNVRRQSATHWKCVVSGCNGRLSTVDDYMKSVSVHSHPQIEDPDTVRLLSTLRTRVQNELIPVQQIYNEEIGVLTDEQAAIQPSFSSVESGLYRHRRKMLPKLPTSRSEVDLRDSWAQTKNNKRFLAINDGDDDKLLVFATDEMLVRMQEADTLFMDGTFYACPGLWDQLYSIHCLSGATMVPVAFALMPKRTRATYVRLFNQLSSVIQEKTGFDLSPEIIQTDFEIAAIQAVEEVFSDAETRGCLFHFSQCMLRKVQALGFMRLYRADQDVQTLVKRPVCRYYL